MKKIFSLIISLLLLASSAFANDNFEQMRDTYELYRLERALPDSAREGMELEIDAEKSIDEGIGELLKKVAANFGAIFKSAIRCIGMVTAIAIIGALVTSVGDGERVDRAGALVCAIAITAAAAGSVSSVFSLGVSVISDMNMFSKSLLPTLAAVSAASGAVTASAMRCGATIAFSDALISIINYALIPLVYAYLAAATADAATENVSVGKISDFIRFVTSWALKLFMGGFVAYLVVSGIVTASADVAGVKTARFAISGVVPVVGGTLADAAGSLIAGAMVMKNAIGVFGMLAILSMCVTPFLTLGVNYFLFKAASAVCAPVCAARTSELVERIGNGFGMVLGMCGACAFLMFMSILMSMYSLGIVGGI